MKKTNQNRQQSYSSDSWESWYPRKEETTDKDMLMLENIFKKHGVSRILDLGCGTGRHTIFFAEREFEVYGFDQSKYAIEKAQKSLRKKNLHADLRVWDMANPFPYENSFFDAVISIRVFHHAKMITIKHVIRQIERVTRKNGYVYVQVPMLERVLKYIKQGGKFNEIEPRTFVPLEGSEKGVPHHNFTKEELLKLFENFKIESIIIRDEHYNLLAIKK